MKMDLKVHWREGVEWIHLGQDMMQWWDYLKMTMIKIS